MKNKSLLSVSMVAGLAMVGCNFLDRSPTGRETDAEFFKTQDQTLRALTAAYNVLGWGEVTEIDEWFIGDIASDDALKGGESPVDQPAAQEIRDFHFTSSNPIVAERWAALYQGINRANQVIENAYKAADMTDSMKTRVRAEARFLRGWYYFELANMYGSVPLVTHVLAPSEYCSAPAPKAQVWAQIKTDFQTAADSLPATYDATQAGRATKGAALAYLAKALIYEAGSDATSPNWAAAEAVADQVIASGVYGLLTDYKDVFTSVGENSKESIFEVQHTHIASGQWGNENLGEMTSIFQGNRLSVYENGWGFDDPTTEFVKEFEPGDPRLPATVIKGGDTIWAGTTASEVADETDSWSGFQSRKYLVEFDPNGLAEMSNDPNNWRAFRYSDLLLLDAEAKIQQGKIAAGVTLINQVRGRASASTVPAGVVGFVKAVLPPVVAADKAGALAALYHERRVELGMEGERFWDVVRRGQADTAFTDTTGQGYIGHGRTFVKGQNEHFPYPDVETSLCPLLK